MSPGGQQTPGSFIGSAEANRRFYARHAAIYDETESCADEAPREQLRAILTEAMQLLGGSPRALDAGGGTGNASLILREIGVETVLVDASPEMIARWEQKARELGVEPNSELVDLETFFGDDDREWDLIVFSSVLHHLLDPAAVLASAGARLAPGGVIVTIFDPLAVDRTGHLLRRLDYAVWIAIHSPATLMRAVVRRVRSKVAPTTGEVNVGALAERHAMTGLDDARIEQRVVGSGVEVVSHPRIFDARYRAIAALSRRLGRPTHFSFILRKPKGQG